MALRHSIHPTLSHVLFLLQPQSQRLPLGLSPRSSGNAFFPESCKEAAPELVKGLLHSFVNNLGLKPGEKIFRAPWKLSTESKGLAEAVGEEFKRQGVRAEALWTIDVSSSTVHHLAREVLHDYFDTLIESIGLPPGVIATPKSIVFPTFKVDSELLYIEANSVEEQEFNLMWDYVQLRAAASPRIELDPNSNQMSARHRTFTAIHHFFMGLKERTEEVVRAEADAGNPEASVDYGLRYASQHYVCTGDLPVANNRLYLGVGCTRNRTLSRAYFIKALFACSATDTLKAMTHGLLIDWYMSIIPKDFGRARHFYAACHHANISARLCRLISPKGVPSSVAVLNFLVAVFEPSWKNGFGLNYLYKDAVQAIQERSEQVRLASEKLHVRQLKQPNRYRCATPGCGIEADAGAKLSQCMFPFLILLQHVYNFDLYQVVDLATSTRNLTTAARDVKKLISRTISRFVALVRRARLSTPVVLAQLGENSGVLRMPVQMPDGSMRYLSSSTIMMDPEELK